MTAGGGTYPEPSWDEAREALRAVSELFKNDPDSVPDRLGDVPNYQTLPEPVQRAIEDLDLDQRRFVSQIFTTLGDNHFYLEGGLGPQAGY